ncbi:MAG: hypothetical protein LRY76_06675 [Alphaproteobacteria bacterium]|nr:hypothetical protein [Alphaproteobacteria bacterium]MCD8571190.1 hypothetical protein [Alphaproteobacteria bacterium]
MTKKQFIQQLVIERFKFHIAHLTAVLHTQDPADEADIGPNAEAANGGMSLGLESATALLRAMNEDLSLLERALEQKN